MYLLNFYTWSAVLASVFHILVHTVTDETIEISISVGDREIPYIVVFFIPILNTILAFNGLAALKCGLWDRWN